MTLLVGRLPVGCVSADLETIFLLSAREAGITYLSLQAADEKTVQNLAGLVTVADVLEGLG